MLLNGDCIEEMQKLIDDGVQVDSIVTDPPYHLQSIVDRFGKEGSAPAKFGTDGAFKRASTGFMGKEWDGGDIAFRKETWELAYKLLKPGGHLLAFSASRNYHRMAVAIEDAGFEIRDQIMWIYGSGFPKSLNISKAIDKAAGVEFASKPAAGVGFMNADGKGSGRGGGKGGYNETKNQLTRQGKSTEEAQRWEGWGTALKPAHEPIVLARKLISEKSIADNVVKHGTGGINIDGCRIPYGEGNEPIPQLAQGKTKVNSTKTMFDGQSLHKSNTEAVIGGSLDGRFPANVMHDGLKEDWARYFYCPKVSKCERGEDNTHPTVKPQELMKYLCRLVTPKGGTVLDPFMGSGSTGMAAKDEGFEFIGVEREKEYFEIAESRITRFAPLMDFM